MGSGSTGDGWAGRVLGSNVGGGGLLFEYIPKRPERGKKSSQIIQRFRAVPTSPRGQSPPCRVTNRLRWDLSIGRLKEVHWLNVGVLEVEWLADGDKADVVIESRGVPALVELHAGDGPALVAGLQVPVVSPGYDPVKQSQLALAAVGGGDDLVPVDDGAAADVAAERLERHLPGKLIWE